MRQRRDWQAITLDVERLGVVEACKRHGIHRSTWYRRRQDEGETPSDRPAQPTESILAISRERPTWGCDRIAYFLGLSGLQVSSPTVQKILIAHGLGRRKQREAHLEAQGPRVSATED